MLSELIGVALCDLNKLVLYYLSKGCYVMLPDVIDLCSVVLPVMDDKLCYLR